MIAELGNHLWQSTLFAAAAALLMPLFRGNPARVRYALWLAASVKFLVPFALLMSLGSRLGWTPSPVTMAYLPIPSAPVTLEQISRPFPTAAAPSATPRVVHDWTPAALLGLWAIGFATVALIRYRGWRRIRQALRASRPVHLPTPLDARACPGLLEPGIVGLWRPVLLLPAGIAGRLTPAQLDAVLAHELCHARRRDNLTAALQMLVEALFWFHPAVWWIGARLLDERERACDEEVLQLGADPRAYAEGILHACRLYTESPLACFSGVTGANLKQRIQVIMANRNVLPLNFTRKAILSIAGACALALPIAIGIIHAPSIRAQSAPAGSPDFLRDLRRRLATFVSPRFQSVSIERGCSSSVGEERKGGGAPRKSGAPAPAAPGSLTLNCTTVAGLIHSAYGTFASGRPLAEADPRRYIDAVPMSGGPGWIYTDQYRVRVQAEGQPPEEMMRGPMMQALLEDRFKIKVSRETRTVPAYALTVAPGGPKLRPFTGDCVSDSVLSPLAPGQQHCWEIGARDRKDAAFTPRFAPDTVVKDLDGFALWLYTITDRPVVNKTGVGGRYFLDFSFAPDQATPGALRRLAIMARRSGNSGDPVAPSNPPGPSLFTALQQEFGLTLEETTAPRDFIRIDHAERPTAN